VSGHIVLHIDFQQKHIDIKHHLISDQTKNQFIDISHKETTEQLAGMHIH
jgi:hypothetical protein